MAEQADGRRMRLLEALAGDGTGRDLGHYARSLDADERTIRRDVDYLHGLVTSLGGIEIRRGRVHGIRRGFEQLKQFSWDDAASQVLTTYHEVAGHL